MARNYRNTSEARNSDMVAYVYASLEAAQAATPDEISEARNDLLTVQGFDSGDFPALEAMDLDNWDDGEVVAIPFYVTIRKRSVKAAPKPRASFKAQAEPSQDADLPS
jgi:hypothetical protein